MNKLMSKLRTIEEELRSNRNICITSMDTYSRPNEQTLQHGYCVKFCVAPVNGLYLPEDLNPLMDSLTSVNPDMKKPFSLFREPSCSDGGHKFVYRLHLGYMNFHEKIGRTRIFGDTLISCVSRSIEGEELERLIKSIIPEGFPGDDTDVNRGIEIRVFPNPKVAEKKFGGNDMGAEMTNLHLEDFVPDIENIYEIYERAYKKG